MRDGRQVTSLGLLAFALFVGCGGPSTADPPSLTLNTRTQSLAWDSVASASSYNLYVKTVGLPLGQISLGTVTVSKSDIKVSSVTSPFLLDRYNKCNTSYFFAAASVNEAGEGSVSGTLGFEATQQCMP